jgi:hypothetical protein
MESVPLHPRGRLAEACDPRIRITRSLLGYGALAGPFYVTAVLVQGLLRPGFDLARHDVSLLANGDFGWVQIAVFVATGCMVVAFAAGVARALVEGPAAKAAPRLLAGFGIGLIVAGVFTADPMNGFPAGAPAGMPTTLTVHGLLHIAAAGIGFLCFVGACLAMARRFARRGQRASSMASALTGVVFLAAFAGLATGSSAPAVVLGFWAALLLAWAWMAALSVHLYRRVGRGLPA